MVDSISYTTSGDTISQLSRPALERGLSVLSELLQKAEAHAARLKVADSALLQARLFPDMHPLARQVQFACDSAKGVVARLSGTVNPKMPDTETSFAELQARVARTLAFVRSISPEALNESETRKVEIPAGGHTLTFTGQAYLLEFALPNFYFHVTTAYGLLRHAGVEIGKRDYLGMM